MLGEADRERSFVAFLVYPDGTEAFREARKVATAMGFRTGWEPFTTDIVFILSGNGACGPPQHNLAFSTPIPVRPRPDARLRLTEPEPVPEFDFDQSTGA